MQFTAGNQLKLCSCFETMTTWRRTFQHGIQQHVLHDVTLTAKAN